MVYELSEELQKFLDERKKRFSDVQITSIEVLGKKVQAIVAKQSCVTQNDIGDAMKGDLSIKVNSRDGTIAFYKKSSAETISVSEETVTKDEDWPLIFKGLGVRML